MYTHISRSVHLGWFSVLFCCTKPVKRDLFQICTLFVVSRFRLWIYIDMVMIFGISWNCQFLNWRSNHGAQFKFFQSKLYWFIFSLTSLNCEYLVAFWLLVTQNHLFLIVVVYLYIYLFLLVSFDHHSWP